MYRRDKAKGELTKAVGQEDRRDNADDINGDINKFDAILLQLNFHLTLLCCQKISFNRKKIKSELPIRYLFHNRRGS